MIENNPSQTVPDGVNIPPAVGTENVTPVASLKDIVKTATGREYATDEAALEGIKNTYSMVGKKVEPQVIEKTIVPEDMVKEVQSLKQEVKTSNWYVEHPEYKDAKDIIAKFGSDPETVVNDPVFQKVYSAMKTVNESANKSVLSSNARIAMPKTDDYAQDLDAMKKGILSIAEFMAKHKGIAMLSEQ